MYRQGNVTTEYYLTNEDLFRDFDNSKVEVSKYILCKNYNTSVSRRVLSIRVFMYFLYLVILDIIENNVIFEFPTVKPLFLMIRERNGKELKNYIKHGYDSKYSLFNSNLKMHQLNFIYYNGYGEERRRSVSLDKTLTNKLYENMNLGLYG